MKGFFRFGSPVIRLAIEGRKIETLLDTGFNGHIMLPNNFIKELALDYFLIYDTTIPSPSPKSCPLKITCFLPFTSL